MHLPWTNQVTTKTSRIMFSSTPLKFKNVVAISVQKYFLSFDEGLTLETSAFQIFHDGNSSFINLGTVHFLRGREGWWNFVGVPPKKKAFKGGHLKKKIRENGGHVKYYLYWRGGHGKKFSYWGRHATS